MNLREGQHKLPDYLVKNRYGPGPGLARRSDLLRAVCRHSRAPGRIHWASSTASPASRKHRIREWLFWQWDKARLAIFRLRPGRRGFRQFGDEVRNMYDTEAKAALSVLEHELGIDEWILGKRPTIADIGCFAVIRILPKPISISVPIRMCSRGRTL